MKRILSGIAIVSLLVPLGASAAYNDVTLESGVVLSVGGVSLTVSGTTGVVESITVNGSSFSFVMSSGSKLRVSSSARKVLSTDSPSAYITLNSCTDNESVIQHAYSGSGTVTVTITPSSDTCTLSGTSSGSGGGGIYSGGGGGGGGSIAAPTVPVTTTTSSGALTAEQKQALIVSLTAQLNALLAQLKALKGGSTGSTFSRDLQVGSTGDDVKALQVYLNTHGYVVASSGPGSPGQETTRFGAATKAALVRLQKAAGISPTSGIFGPKTRAYIQANP